MRLDIKTLSYHKEHYLKNKDKYRRKNREFAGKVRQYITNYKSNKICQDCKKIYHHSSMQFDHITGVKKFTIGQAPGQYGVDKVKQEIEKCELVCTNCHENRTRSRKLEKKSKRNYITGKIKWLYELKESLPCIDCAKLYSYYQMQFDHVIGNKKFMINSATIYRYSIESIYLELMKCDAVCGNCHSYRTYLRRRGAA